MTVSSVWIVLVFTNGVHCALGSTETEGLFLTPYIEACEYEEAKSKSKVHLFPPDVSNATMHSGYITVDNTTNSSLFFLLTIAEEEPDSAPLLLWTQGGPGLSALFGLFLENGPAGVTLSVKGEPKFYQRTNTLQKFMHVIYLDLPVGTGFSFTKDPMAYPKTLEEVVDHVIKFLQQFLTLFSEYKGRHLYLGGESYGARYSVATANMIIKNPEKLPVNLAGVIGGNGFLGPVLTTANSTDFLYEVSMLTTQGRKEFAERFNNMSMLFQAASHNPNITLLLLKMLFETIFIATPSTLFQNLTSYNDHASPLYTERPAQMLICYSVLNTSKALKMAIHAGENADFQYNNPSLLYSFLPDWLIDITQVTETVFENTNILLYLGQMDALFPSVNQRAYLNTLKWSRSSDYHSAHRELWRPMSWSPHSGHAGYVKKITNLTVAVLLGMSHYGAAEKPDEVFYLVKEFVNAKHSAA